MKHYVRSFAIGLFFASSLILVMYLIIDSPKNSKSLSDSEMLTHLKDSGYRVVSESEYISLSVQEDLARQKKLDEKKQSTQNNTAKSTDTKKAAEKDKSNDKDKKDAEADKKEKEKPKTYTIDVKSGMAPSEISDLLKEHGLIKDARKYDKYLKKHGYEKYIQLGKHKLNSDMSEYEIAEALKKYAK